MNFSPSLDKFFFGVFLLILISVPLAIWKIIDILIWVFSSVEVSVK